GRVVERSAAQPLARDDGLPRLHHLVEDASRLDGAPEVGRDAVDVPGDAEQALERIEEPRLAAHRQVEARVAVGHDGEAGLRLLPDDAADRVEILLAEARIAEGVLERAAVQHLGEPRGSWP